MSGEQGETIPFAETITMLSALKKLYPDSAGVKAMIAESGRVVNPAMEGIASNPYLQQKFGHGIHGVMKLAPVMHQHMADKATKELLDMTIKNIDQRTYVKASLDTGVKLYQAPK